MSEFKFPTEEVELPSKGLIYPKDNPLSSGKIEIKYMTAKEEDILTNQNYVKQVTVVDKLLKSLIIHKYIKKTYKNQIFFKTNRIYIHTTQLRIYIITH